jgi:hypothetical protein
MGVNLYMRTAIYTTGPLFVLADSAKPVPIDEESTSLY